MKITVGLVWSYAALASAALEVNLTSRSSIIKTAKLKASDVMSYYHGTEPGRTIGILPGPPPEGDYYWWMAGALWGTMIDYWHHTRDTTYNPLVSQALLFQAGGHRDFMELNWTASLGNDDQAFWGMSALLAAEAKFPDPVGPGQPSWLGLAQGVFNTQADRFRSEEACGGGLRWQIFPLNNGYEYKNAIANGCFFNIGARLARYTGNQSYAHLASEAWDWMQHIGFIDDEYNVYDGGHVPQGCRDTNTAQYSYNAAVLLQGAAFLYNFTDGSALWYTRVDALLNRTLEVFFINGTATEISCEPLDPSRSMASCTTDMLSYKGYLHRWLSVTAQLAPFTYERIFSVLRPSTAAAVAQCTGGAGGRACGFRWITGMYSGGTGLPQEMNVLGALVSLLADVEEEKIDGKVNVGKPDMAPVTNSTGGTSVGDPGAAGGREEGLPGVWFAPVTTADRGGAAAASTVVLVLCAWTWVWMASIVGETEPCWEKRNDGTKEETVMEVGSNRQLA